MGSFVWLINPVAAYYLKVPLIVLASVFAAFLALIALLVYRALKKEKNSDDS